MRELIKLLIDPNQLALASSMCYLS